MNSKHAVILTGVLCATLGLPPVVSAKESETEKTAMNGSMQAPSASPALPGPMPSEQEMPVSRSQMPGARLTAEEARSKRIHTIQRLLDSRKLTPIRRQELERELADLNVKTMINTPSPSSK